jgi:hemoglobin
VSGSNQGVDNISVPSLYEWAGGTSAFEKLTAIFYRHVLEEPLLKPLFENMPPEHSHRVAMWIAEIFGGPKSYSGRFDKDTAHPHMMSRHLGLNITEQQRFRWVETMLKSADEAGFPTDPEFRSAFIAYMEWGTRIALIMSQPGMEVPEKSPMPKWGWGEVKPLINASGSENNPSKEKQDE